MNEEDGLRVCEALGLTHQECAHVVERFATSEQLHQFVLNYNSNDGVLPLLAVVRHPRCDAGTATRIYWLFEDLIFDPNLRASTTSKSAEWDCNAVLVVIESRFRAGDFASSEIYFNPREEYQWNVIQQKKLVASGVDPQRLAPIGSNHVQRQWLP